MNTSKTSWYYDNNYTNEEIELFYYRAKLIIEPDRVNCSDNPFMVKISADSKYKLYINGVFVEVGPSRSNSEVWYYDVVNLSPFLKAGVNIIAVIVRHDPTAHWTGNCGFYRTKTFGLYFEPLQQDNSYHISKWKTQKLQQYKIVRENPYFSPLMILEQQKGVKENQGWLLEEYDDSQWAEAKEWEYEKLTERLRPDKLLKRTIPFMKRTSRQFVNSHFPVKINANEKMDIILDAGELMTGFIRLCVIGGENAVISILQSECYADEPEQNENPYNTLPRKSKRTDSSLQLYGYTDEYTVCGTGTKDSAECYEPFWLRTFRYIKLSVETKSEPITLISFDYEETGYPLNIRTRVETSDESLNKIWDICERTLRRCMHETYEDCPFYEQLQYAMDTRNQILYTYAISADDRLAKQCMEDFRYSAIKLKREELERIEKGDDQRRNLTGLINCSAPNYERNIIPGFSIYYIGMLYDHMMYFGEKEWIKKHISTAMGILDFFERNLTAQGIVGKIGDVNKNGNDWSFIDWTPEWDKTDGVPSCTTKGPVTMESFLYLLGLEYAAKLTAYIDMKELSADYSKKADSLKKAINTYCLGKNKMYQDGPAVDEYSQHCQVFAVLTDTVSIEQGKKNLLETLEHKEKYAQCSVAMMFYVFRALEKCGLYEYTNDLWNIWRDMLKNDMTTCAEDSLRSRSDCHAWGALALYEIPSVILGVRPTAPKIYRQLPPPQLSYLSWAKGKVVTPDGEIETACEF